MNLIIGIELFSFFELSQYLWAWATIKDSSHEFSKDIKWIIQQTETGPHIFRIAPILFKPHGIPKSVTFDEPTNCTACCLSAGKGLWTDGGERGSQSTGGYAIAIRQQHSVFLQHSDPYAHPVKMSRFLLGVFGVALSGLWSVVVFFVSWLMGSVSCTCLLDCAAALD